MKKISLFLVAALSLLPGIVFGEEWSGGTGKSSDPYRISTVADLQQLAKAVNGGTSFRKKYFIQTVDLDLAALKGVVGWSPIGTYGGNGFNGTYDGNGHKISGLSINNSFEGQGLFGYIDGGTVKNVIVTGCDISASNFVGGIVGYNHGTVTGCAVLDGHITVGGTFCSGGGIAGMVNLGTVTSCLVSGCTIESNYSSTGGIAGSMLNGSFTDCSVDECKISGGSHMGGIVGYNEGGMNNLRNNRYTETVKGVKGGVDGFDFGGASSGEVVTKIMEAPKVTAPAVAATTQATPAQSPAPAPQSVAPATVVPASATPSVQTSASTAANTTVAPSPSASSAPVTTTTVASKKTAKFVSTAKPGDSESYIVKTSGVKKPERKLETAAVADASKAQQDEPTDFMGKNFRFYSLCDWQEGMRFMVMPEKYDLLVNTFRDGKTGKEVSSGLLRHRIMVYKGHETTPDNRVHVNFYCENDQKNYYYQLPNGTFEDYCYGKMGVPTLAYLGDVDKARELLIGEVLLTRTQFFRVDTEYDGDGYKDITVEKNKAVTVKAIGVGTRSFPVKIIVEDENGKQFFQNVAMSKTNCGMRDDEFQVDNAKFLFTGSFDYSGGEMAVSDDVKSYLNKTIYTRVSTAMSSKGSGKVRDVKVPRFTGFIVDEIEPVKNTRYYTLTLRESETRRVYYKDVTFTQEDVVGDGNGAQEDYFGHVFAVGEGMIRSTSLETRTAIREGRVIPGMSTEEVEMAMGEATTKLTTSDGITEWYYPRTNSVLVVQFDSDGHVKQAKARANGATTTKKKTAASRTRQSGTRRGNLLSGNGTPL